ncbi:hypothetical protein [Pseudomonas sp.]|uniref:hypothetical protein n=1 Tax=Pseudomonas sp. TaxID=306 RepID=UPI00261562C6|nr:hypothetical protein [Pseudomonas sp.]
MSEYTPITDEVRFRYIEHPYVALDEAEADHAEFDRWLDQVKAAAWAEGHAAGEANTGDGFAALIGGGDPPEPRRNPYTPEEETNSD